MEKMWDGLAWALAAVSLVAIAVFLAYILPDAKYGLAAWLQAVGSLFALGVAIYVMSRQNLNAARLVAEADRRTTLRRAKSVQAILERAENQLKIIDREMRTSRVTEEARKTAKNECKAASTVLDQIEANMNAIPVLDLGSYEMTTGVLRVLEVLKTYRLHLDMLSKFPDRFGSTSVVSGLDHFNKSLNAGLDGFKTGLKELEHPQNPPLPSS